MKKYTFTIQGKELEKADEFAKEHNKMHKGHGGAIGGRFTYSFTVTSIGTAVCIKCACGDELNVTDYDDW